MLILLFMAGFLVTCLASIVLLCKQQSWSFFRSIFGDKFEPIYDLAADKAGGRPTNDYIVKAIFDEKLLPAGVSKFWFSFKQYGGAPIWYSRLRALSDLKVYATTIVVPASSHFPLWRPTVTDVCKGRPTSTSGDTYSCSTVVSTWSKPLSPLLQLTSSDDHVTRTWQCEDDHSWVIESCSNHFTYFLLQPLLESASADEDPAETPVESYLSIISSRSYTILGDEAAFLKHHFCSLQRHLSSISLPLKYSIPHHPHLHPADPAADKSVDSDQGRSENTSNSSENAVSSSSQSAEPNGLESSLEISDNHYAPSPLLLSINSCSSTASSSPIAGQLDFSTVTPPESPCPDSLTEDLPQTQDSQESKDYNVLAQQCFKLIKSEAASASKAVHSSLDGEQTKGGWAFHCTEKDVAVFRKEMDSGSVKWLGKGIVKAPLESVWTTVSNPQSRFLFDEALKSVDVLSDFGNGMKLIHLRYEFSGLLKNNCHEFYLLQSEMVQSHKKYVCFQSIKWPQSPPKNTARGRFLCSGWLVERVDTKSKSYTALTYLSHIELDSDLSSSSQQQFEEDVILKQPLCIPYLREYLHAPPNAS